MSNRNFAKGAAEMFGLFALIVIFTVLFMTVWSPEQLTKLILK